MAGLELQIGEKSYFHMSRNSGIIFKSKYVAEIIHKMFYKSWNSKYTYLIELNKDYKPPKLN